MFDKLSEPNKEFELPIPDVETTTVSQLKELLWKHHQIEASNIHKMLAHGTALEDDYDTDFENELITYGIGHNAEILLITKQFDVCLG